MININATNLGKNLFNYFIWMLLVINVNTKKGNVLIIKTYKSVLLKGFCYRMNIKRKEDFLLMHSYF